VRALEGLAASPVRQKAAQQPKIVRRNLLSFMLHARPREPAATASLNQVCSMLSIGCGSLSCLHSLLFFCSWQRLHVSKHLFSFLLSTWLLWAQATSSCQRISSSRSSELGQSTCELGTCRGCPRRSERIQCKVLRVRQGPSRHDGRATPCAVRPCRGGAPPWHLSMPLMSFLASESLGQWSMPAGMRLAVLRQRS